jgi:glyoxylase-like metal-dependent hydrolase (beta-lactamase superfamily II)
MPLTLSRRAALSLGAALPLAAPALLTATSARADGHAKAGPGLSKFRRAQLGDFEVTTLLAGTRTVEGPQNIFGMNVDAETFKAASDEAFLPVDAAQFFFTPTVVNTGSEVILFDTGLSPDSITSALGAAGYAPGDITHVVITHMHGDHVGGLMGEAGETFEGAAYITGAAEHNHWSGAGGDTFDGKVAPLNDKLTFVDDGASIASGVTAMAAFGHTPGHMTYMLESGGKQLLLMADMANHYVWSLGYPDWEVKFDMDKAAAAATRRRVLGMLAADRIPMVGYHMPWPGMGYVTIKGDGFEYVPVSYQMML